MDAAAILSKLRDGVTPTGDEIRWFADGLATGAVSDAQTGAFAMAVCQAGLSDEGQVALTLAMRDSGEVLKWDMPAPVVDKHSTGGVGDCVSLLLAPMLAAAGIYVPMISGRGLGHTGGTLDKLEAIPGISATVEESRFREIVADVGCAIVSATADIAPADRRLYAIRDVTGTVKSIDLVTASILSKKLAAGLDALILDVKTGSGAVMQKSEDARQLAEALVSVANGAGCPTKALISDMNSPLAPAAGNALEIAVVMQCLTEPLAPATARLVELTVRLGAGLLQLCGSVEQTEQGAALLRDALSSGAAAERFGKMVAAMGGPKDFLDTWPDQLTISPLKRAFLSPQTGTLCAIDGIALGMTVVDLGGGRKQMSDRINPSVGISDIAELGTEVVAGQPLAMIHAADESAAEAAQSALDRAFTIGDGPYEATPLIHGMVP